MVEKCLLTNFPDQFPTYRLTMEQERKEVMRLFTKHVPDGNVMKVTAVAERINKELRSSVSGFLSKFAPVLMLMALNSQQV